MSIKFYMIEAPDGSWGKKFTRHCSKNQLTTHKVEEAKVYTRESTAKAMKSRLEGLLGETCYVVPFESVRGAKY